MAGPVRVFAGARLPVPTGSLDLIVSKSVLEHVSGRDLPTLVGEMNRALRADAGMAHLIDLRDHMHVSGDDGVRGDWLDALRYPDWLFRAMFSRRPTGINRLRSSEWRRLLEDRGFSMAAWETTRFPLPPGFDKASLQEPWRSYDDATLSIAWLCVGARKPTGPARPTS